MARRAGPRGYVPARRPSGPSTPAPLHPRLAEERVRALEAGRAARQRSRPWAERLAAAKTKYALESGYRSRAAYERAIKEADRKFGLSPEIGREIRRDRYWNVVREFRDTMHPGMKLQDVRTREDFRAVLIDLYSTDRAPDGPLAKALVRLGRRDPSATYRVGDTPK